MNIGLNWATAHNLATSSEKFRTFTTDHSIFGIEKETWDKEIEDRVMIREFPTDRWVTSEDGSWHIPWLLTVEGPA